MGQNKTGWGRKDWWQYWGYYWQIVPSFHPVLSLPVCSGFGLCAAVPWDGGAWPAASLWRGPAGLSCSEASVSDGWLQHTRPLPASGRAFPRSHARSSSTHVPFCTPSPASLSGGGSGLPRDAALPHGPPGRDAVEPHSYSSAQAKGGAGHASAEPAEGGGSRCHGIHFGALERSGRLQSEGQYGCLPHNCTPVVRLWMHSLWSRLLYCEYCEVTL